MTISTTTLKNAAFAIEYDLFTDPNGCNYLVKDGAILRRWEPEHDDGDALRLAVALDMRVRWHSVLNQALAQCLLGSEVSVNGEDCKADRYLATRTVIVLCASDRGATL